MSVHIRTIPAADHPAQAMRLYRWAPSIAALAVMLLAFGCASAPTSPFAATDPANPAAPVKRTGYRSTVEPYVRQRPVEPSPWREQNERVAPAPKE